jgi:FtsZ-binding cell division protein ZapB
MRMFQVQLGSVASIVLVFSSIFSNVAIPRYEKLFRPGSDQLDKLTWNVGNVSSTIEDLRIEIKILRNGVDDLQNDMHGLRNDMDVLRKEMNRLRNDVGEKIAILVGSFENSKLVLRSSNSNSRHF